MLFKDNASKISKTRKRLIWYFVFVYYIIAVFDASGLSILMNRIYFNVMGYNMVSFILLLPLFRFVSVKFMKEFRLTLSLLTIYVLYQFIRTSIAASPFQALTVFRYSFMQCLNFFIAIPFILSLSKEEMDYMTDKLLKSTIIFSVLYLSDILIYDWMGVSNIRYSVETQGGVSVFRSIIGYPLLDPFWLSLFIPLSILDYPKAKKVTILFLFALFMSYTRNQLLSCVVVFSVIVLFLACKDISKLGKVTKFLFVLSLLFLVVSIVIPDSLKFWIGKLGNIFSDGISDETGTFDYRIGLIDRAIEAISEMPLIGLGYVNDAAYGERSMVLGGDTYIAPILYCEGFLGLFLRTLPFVVLLLSSLKKYFNYTYISIIDLAFIAGFVGSCVNYVQTKALTNFTIILGLYFIYMRKQYLDEVNPKKQKYE